MNSETDSKMDDLVQRIGKLAEDAQKLARLIPSIDAGTFKAKAAACPVKRA